MRITGYDNRSRSSEYPYGFVYFDNETRIGYAPGADGGLGPFNLFVGNWGSVTGTQYKQASEFLRKKFPEVYLRETTKP